MVEVMKKILVVDDNPKNLQVVAALLAENYYEVEVAIGGRAALIWLEQVKFDAILLDVMMPELDGFETCELIKQDPANKNIPIIFLTARQDVESITTAFNIGGVDYLSKPFNHDELLARLATHLELKESREKLVNVNKWLQEEVDKKTEELNKTNTELENANKQLISLDIAKNDFLKSISHEIRTPLNGICGSLNLLKNYSDDDYFTEVIALLDSSVTNLEKYSYAALQIANLQVKGDQYLSFQDADFGCVSENCLANIEDKNTVQKLNVVLQKQCADSPIMADIKYLQAAISALINCSLTYTKQGYLRLTIVDKEENYVLKIEDSGCLYSKNKVSHYFDSINSQNYQFERNNAIELHLAKIIIQLHKGVLTTDNNEDNDGTITVITIPKA